jgi:Arc/MetJ family transcription regulator
MKSITLRTLVREPLKVKRMTRTGQPVRVTDSGQPLWILQPAGGTDADEGERRCAIEKMFNEVLRERPSRISAARLLEESRR